MEQIPQFLFSISGLYYHFNPNFITKSAITLQNKKCISKNDNTMYNEHNKNMVLEEVIKWPIMKES